MENIYEHIRKIFFDKLNDYHFAPNNVCELIHQDPTVQEYLDNAKNESINKMMEGNATQEQIENGIERTSNYILEKLCDYLKKLFLNPMSIETSDPFSSKTFNPYKLSQKERQKIVDKWKGIN